MRDRAPRVDPGRLSDTDFWGAHLQPKELLVWTGRPDAGFRLYGMGKLMMWSSIIGGVLIPIAFLPLLAEQSRHLPIIAGALAILFGLIVGFGPARLDQVNRRARRFAITDHRVISTRDVSRERPKQLTLQDTTKMLHIYDDDLDSHGLTFANMDANNKVSEMVTFDRMTEDQALSIVDLLTEIRKAA